jgi:hypothetical protein
MDRALAGPWPNPRLATEDDLDEMWRRIEGMLPFFGARMADLGDIRLVDLVGENSVLGLLSKGVVEPTPMYQELDEFMSGFEPGLVCLDVLADLFSGEESNRPQVTQFVGLLKRLCRKHHDAFEALQYEGRNVIDTKGTAYAPAIFAAQPDAQGISNEQFRAAMDRLFKAKKIHVLDRGRPSKPNRTIALTAGFAL